MSVFCESADSDGVTIRWMLGLRNFIRRLRSVQAGDEEGIRRGADNFDAEAAATGRKKPDFQGGEFPGSVPPNYIKSYDEGRPRH